MKLYLALAFCVALCSGQDTEVNPDVNVDMAECQQFCRRGGRCPSTTAVISTVLRLPTDCRGCILEECGPAGRNNRTEVADCWFAARLVCDGCLISNATRGVRRGCMACLEQCGEDIAAGNRPVVPTPRTVRPMRPGFGRRPGFGSPFIVSPGLTGNRGGRTGQVGRRPTGNFRPFGNFRPGGSFGGARCTCRSECANTRALPNAQCRRCLFSQCSNAGNQGGAFTTCIRQARTTCTACNSTQQANTRRECAECINRCRGQNTGRGGGRGGTTGGTNGGMGRTGGMGGQGTGSQVLCDRNCVAPGFCPSTNAIMNTINRSPQPCRQCVRAACGQTANQTRDESAQCMFDARPNCSGCGFGSASRMQRQRCSVCRMQCEDDDTMATDSMVTDTMTASSTTVSTEERAITASGDMEEMS